MHALVAAATSILLGLVMIRPGDYRYWRYWAGRTFGFASAGLILSFGLAGLMGFAVLRAVEPGGASAGAAAIEGLAGHAVFRAKVDFGESGDETTGRSLLGLVRGWLLELLGGGAHTAIRSRLTNLNDHALTELAFDIFWENTYGGDPSLRAVAVEQYESLKQAVRRLGGAEAVDARASLRGFCLAEIERHRLILVG